ncbi:hypothetical protein BBJ28_00004831 [Nothophytophthora sp. Chile5]|nr:hypothetical protein BBJ28_00004831 [Nothophytophthora sp. Chile5]
MKQLLVLALVLGQVLGISSGLATPLSGLQLLATPLPTHLSIQETVQGPELRLYLPENDPRTIRVTPTSAGVLFTPSFVLFNATTSIATGLGLVAVANASGSLTIQYVATLESNSSTTAVLLSQSISVLAAPTVYELTDLGWDGVVIQSDSFDQGNGSMSSFWSEQKHGYPSSACGSFDGQNALFFTSLGDRFAVTAPLGLQGFHGKMHFYHLYGFQMVEKYNAQGDNRITCERPEVGEEVTFEYLPLRQDPQNVSAWQQIAEIPLSSSNSSNTSAFVRYSVLLPEMAMHANAQFSWRQKTHSSFPIDVTPGLTTDEVVAAENDPTGVQGQMGGQKHKFWNYRNLFDQWAIDDVQLEVRLDAPTFALMPGDGVGVAYVLVASPVPGSWLQALAGDGTQAFLTCATSAPANSSNEAVVSLKKSGYVHAVACLPVGPSLISSYPVRSPRFLVQAQPPIIISSLKTNTSLESWEIHLQCSDCEYLRYVIASISESEEDASSMPSCSFGVLVNASSGILSLTSNGKLRVVACGSDLLASELVESEPLVVHPHQPSFKYQVPATTITGFMNLTLVPPVQATSNTSLGVAYSIGSAEDDAPVCGSSLVSGEITVVVKVFAVVRAVTCCLDVACEASAVATWGPVQVQAVVPTYSSACSAITPLTLVVQLFPVTVNASVRYRIEASGASLPPLTCTTGLLYESPVAVGNGAASVSAVSCLDGLQASDPAKIPAALDNCCAGLTAYLSASCAHVLLLEDTFSTCPGDGGVGDVHTNTNWQAVTSQWGGGDVNGGVHSDNVQCVLDPDLGKSVLALNAHGDIFLGSEPVGKALTSDGSLRDRTTDDRYLEWALEGVSPLPCRPLERCPARRVGATVTSALKRNSGVMVLQIKPCMAFGTLTQVWWGNYEAMDVATSGDKGVPFLPLWKSALYQAKTTPSTPFTLTSPPSVQYSEVVMQWDATAGRTNLYVDGQLVLKQTASALAAQPSNASSGLSIGVWFPNAVAGEPLFSTCQVLVDEVQVFDLQVTGGRWCDYEAVQVSAVACFTDDNCLDWVHTNCFMPIYEAVCVRSRSNDSDDERSKPNPAAKSPPTTGFCQFRLEPTTQTSVFSTAMTPRSADFQWQEQEEATLDEAVGMTP